MARPVSSASCAERSADSTIASIITSRLSRGSGRAALASIISVSSCWSREPQFTPMRTGLPFAIATSTICANCSSCRLRADVARVDAVLGKRRGAVGVLGQQQMAVVVKVADERHADAQPSSCWRMTGTACAAASLLTVTRTSSEPACASCATWIAVAIGVGGVGVRHRLHHDRVLGADRDAPNVDGDAAAPLDAARWLSWYGLGSQPGWSAADARHAVQNWHG